ncbi:beta-1,4-glucuronyltransferase 1 [Leptinotarsa decemlineata]|uniref:beta-1,4-glucuronyltransferase 1 n=1 Tax=Leptinotarsa decemlineata TaxID=7539 RepID=UPI003D30448F
MFPKISFVYQLFAFVSLVIFVIMVIPHQQHANSRGTPRFLLKNPPEKEVEYRGNFIVFRNYIQADMQFRSSESVTLSVPGDYRFLDNILQLVDRWRGPISVALYAPGYDFFSTLQSIAYLRICSGNSLVKELVTFHLFFEHDHIPIQHDRPLLDIYRDEFDCSQKPPFETVKDGDMYKERKNLTYPINVARNVAKLNAQTHFVFPSDIELYPTRNFIKEFLEFVQKRPDYFKKNSTNVFVLPLFEILEGYRIPETKKELQDMIRNKTAITFHEKVCGSCHRVPRVKEWLEQTDTIGLDVFTAAKRHGKQIVWEPFFVCTQKEPLWDERLNWEGQGNKMCQAYYLCMLDYDFLVLDNAFLIHKPGVKKKKVQNIKHKDQKYKNDLILKSIQDEITKIYGENDKCRIHNLFLNN